MYASPFPDEERVGINEKVGDKVSIVSETSGTCSDKLSRNIVGGDKVRTNPTPVKLKEKRTTYADKVRTGKQ